MEKACETCVHKDKPSFSATCVECGFAMMNYEHIPFTNADCIREWSDEEIAEFIIGVMDGAFELFTGAKMPDENRRAMKAEWLDWLRKEVKDG